MSFSRYQPEELPAALSRTVRWRWPRERLLLAVPCEAEWFLAHPAWGPRGAEDRSSLAAEEPERRVDPGVLGVTEERIIFRSLDRPGTVVRAAAGVFAVLAVLGYIAELGATMTAVAGGLALVLWVAGRVIDTLGLGAGSVRLRRILEMDRAGCRISGIDDWGVHYRLRLSEPDLEQVARLVVG